MSMQPLLLCKKCGYVSFSAFGSSGAGSFSVVSCAQSCGGCGTTMAHPDMFGHGGHIHMVNRDPNVISILANIADSVHRGEPFEVTELEYGMLPDWAKRLVDLARHNGALAALVITSVVWMLNRGCDLVEVSHEKNLELRNNVILQGGQFDHDSEIQSKDHKFQSEMQERSFEHDRKMQAERDLKKIESELGQASPVVSSEYSAESDGSAPFIELLGHLQKLNNEKMPTAWSDLLNRLRDLSHEVHGLRGGKSISRHDLNELVGTYNETLGLLYQIVHEESSRMQPKILVEPKLSHVQISYSSPFFTTSMHLEFEQNQTAQNK